MKTTFTFLIFTLYSLMGLSQDWSGVAIPADPGTGKEWVIQDNFSDDFNYSAPASNKGGTFFAKWDDFYHNAWQGPGLTTWARNHSLVEGGELKLIASRLGTTGVSAGAVHSQGTVAYPAYVEIRAKIMNSVLANGGWMLSPDDTQEIDFMEGYGATWSESQNKSQSWYAQRMHQSHHVFVRSPFQDWQPSEFGSNTGNPSPHPTWITRNDGAGNINWKDDYHTYGVYWQDPTHLYYYIDGVLVTKREGMEQIDPVHYTNANVADAGNTSVDTRTGLNKAMYILFTVEDQDWRSGMNPPLTPTNNELANTENHTLRIDWIRVYKAENVAGVDDLFNSEVSVYPNPFEQEFNIEAKVNIKNIAMYSITGVKVKSLNGLNTKSKVLSTTDLASGLYLLEIESIDGLKAYKKIFKN